MFRPRQYCGYRSIGTRASPIVHFNFTFLPQHRARLVLVPLPPTDLQVLELALAQLLILIVRKVLSRTSSFKAPTRMTLVYHTIVCIQMHSRIGNYI